MRILRRVGPGLAAAAALVGLALFALPRLAGGPLGPLPGGRLAGPEAPCPDPARGGFDFARGVRQVQVEVRPGRPRSVTTWALVREGALYVPADWLTPWKTWPHLALEDPRVRVRIDGRVYACRATRVRDAEAIARLRRQAAAKYDVDPRGRAAQVQVWWFRLGPRAAAEAGGSRPRVRPARRHGQTRLDDLAARSRASILGAWTPWRGCS